MKKRETTLKGPKPNKLGFQSGISIYKEKFSEKKMTFRPKFSITKNIQFSSQKKIANNLAKSFKRIVLLKF
mgnify:CR=1 FL=1